ncbi:SGNH hydrolase-type esterase domain-containing protein [Obelidium mucronatum]|nr:SGNH hydrolase-type esterase domain-containing protein [Obelidium mucronatum]
MTLFLGANDAVDPAFNQRHNVSLPRYKQNMHEMLDTVRRESPGTKVIIITPPPVNPEVYKETCKAKGKVRDRNAQHTKKYRDACIEVFMEAAETWGRDLVLVDIWYVFFGVGRAEHELKELEDLLFDGLHLGMKGNQLLGKALLETINHSWPELNPDVLPVVGGIEK